MEKMQKSKKIGIIVGVVLLLTIVIVVGLKSCDKDEMTDKGIKETGKEVQIEEKESEDGLDVLDSEDADSEDSQGNVDFFGPDNAADDKSAVTEKENVENNNNATDNSKNDTGTDNGSDTGKTDGAGDDTENKENVGNLDETDDNSSGGYGEFF